MWVLGLKGLKSYRNVNVTSCHAAKMNAPFWFRKVILSIFFSFCKLIASNMTGRDFFAHLFYTCLQNYLLRNEELLSVKEEKQRTSDERSSYYSQSKVKKSD